MLCMGTTTCFGITTYFIKRSRYELLRHTCLQLRVENTLNYKAYYIVIFAQKTGGRFSSAFSFFFISFSTALIASQRMNI